jgi:hypothetical protein
MFILILKMNYFYNLQASLNMFFVESFSISDELKIFDVTETSSNILSTS